MKLRTIFLLLVLCCTGSIYAQSVYELNYHFDTANAKDERKAFLYCNGDGTGFIRVKYFDKQANADILVHMELQEEYAKDKNNNTDYTRKVFRGINPHIITGDTNYRYTPDQYWFKVNPDQGYFEPASVVAVNAGKELTGVYSAANFIEMNALTQDFVLQYFTEEDGFYKNVFEPKSRGNNTGGARMHLITVTNTGAPDIEIGRAHV